MTSRTADSSQGGKILIVLGGFAVVAYILWTLGQDIVGGSFNSALFMVAVFVAFAVAGRTLTDWRQGIFLFVGWLLFEDLIRKYMGNNMYVYFAKDALVLATYISFATDRARNRKEPFKVPFRTSLLFFFVLGLVQVLNFNSPSVWYGIMGLKLYFFYIPLMFIGYGLVQREKDLRRFLVATMTLAGVIATIGIIQAVVSIDFLNPHSGADIEELSHVLRGTESGLVVARPVAVFVSDGRYSQFLALSFIIGLGTAGYLLLRKREGYGRHITFTALGLLAVAAMLSGSRGAVMMSAISGVVLAMGMVWGAPTKFGEGYRLVKAIRRSFVFVVIALALAITLFPETVGSRLEFYKETLSPDSSDFELGHRSWSYPVSELEKAFKDPDWIIGHGLGTASLGGQYVQRIMGAAPSDVAVENGFGTLVLEIGILGPILWLWWSFTLLHAGYRSVLRVKGTWGFPIGASILWFCFFLLIAIMWSGIGGYENYILNAYLWILVGIMFRLPKLVNETEQPS